MLDLDYAFLADYATIQDGKLTSISASFTRLVVPEVPAAVSFSIAGRIRTDEPDRDEVTLTLRIASPGEDGMTIEATNTLDARESTVPPYSGHRRGMVFAVQATLPILATGLYRVEIDLDDTPDVDRVLYFEAVLPPAAE